MGVACGLPRPSFVTLTWEGRCLVPWTSPRNPAERLRSCGGPWEYEALRNLAADLRSLGLHAVDSAANFLFVPSPVPGHLLFRRLLHLGVIIRALDEYGLPGHVRISVGSQGENRFLIDCLRTALEREGSPV